jgi:hypothetical protein
MRWRKLWWALTGLVLLASIARLVLWPQPERVTRENFARIHKGMTRAEVVAILGPPGDYRTGPAVPVQGVWDEGDQNDEGGRPRPQGFVLIGGAAEVWGENVWCNDTLTAILNFTPESKVLGKVGWVNERVKQGPLDHLHWRLERQRRRWFP